jgi:hypothetical protein
MMKGNCLPAVSMNSIPCFYQVNPAETSQHLHNILPGFN